MSKEARLKKSLKEATTKYDKRIKDMEDKQYDSDTYRALAEKAEKDYITIQGNIIAVEKRCEKLDQQACDILERQEKGIARIKDRYETWKLNELDKMAKMKLKGKIDNIDKAGLKDILDG